MGIYSNYITESYIVNNIDSIENITESIEKEFDNFNKICESVNILSENGIILEAEEQKKSFWRKLIEKIIKLKDQLVSWFKTRFSRFKILKNAIKKISDKSSETLDYFIKNTSKFSNDNIEEIKVNYKKIKFKAGEDVFVRLVETEFVSYQKVLNDAGIKLFNDKLNKPLTEENAKELAESWYNPDERNKSEYYDHRNDHNDGNYREYSKQIDYIKNYFNNKMEYSIEEAGSDSVSKVLKYYKTLKDKINRAIDTLPVADNYMNECLSSLQKDIDTFKKIEKKAEDKSSVTMYHLSCYSAYIRFIMDQVKTIMSMSNIYATKLSEISIFISKEESSLPIDILALLKKAENYDELVKIKDEYIEEQKENFDELKNLSN